MIDVLVAIVATGAAAWRVASLLVDERGPGRVFERLRSWAGVPRVGEQSPRPFVGGVLSCLWCCSVWTAAATWYALRREFDPLTDVVGILAASAVAIAIEEWVGD